MRTPLRVLWFACVAALVCIAAPPRRAHAATVVLTPTARFATQGTSGPVIDRANPGDQLMLHWNFRIVDSGSSTPVLPFVGENGSVTLPDSVTFDGIFAPSGCGCDVTPAGQTINFRSTQSGQPSHGIMNFHVLCTVRADVPKSVKSLVFQWRLEYHNGAAITAIDDHTMVLGLRGPPPAQVDVSITAPPGPAAVGDELEITVDAVSPNDLPKLVLQATLPAGTSFVAGSATPTTKPKGRRLQWVLRDVKTAQAKFRVRVDSVLESPDCDGKTVVTAKALAGGKSFDAAPVAIALDDGIFDLAVRFEPLATFPGQPDDEVEPGGALTCFIDFDVRGAVPTETVVQAILPPSLTESITQTVPRGKITRGTPVGDVVRWTFKAKALKRLPPAKRFVQVIVRLKKESDIAEPGTRRFHFAADIAARGKRKTCIVDQRLDTGVNVLCGATIPDDARLDILSGVSVAAATGWSGLFQLSSDDGIVATDLQLGSKIVAAEMSLPYYVVETSNLAATRLELNGLGAGGSTGRSRLVELSNGLEDGAHVLRAKFAVDRLGPGSSSCLFITQEYELRPTRSGAANRCSPWYPRGDLNFVNCARFFPRVSYEFVGTLGEQLILVQTFQRMKLRVGTDTSPANANVALFRDLDPKIPFVFEADSLNPAPTERDDVVIAAGVPGTWDQIQYTNLPKIIGPTGEPESQDNLARSSTEAIQIHWRWGARLGAEFGGGSLLVTSPAQTVRMLVVNEHAGDEDPFDAFDLPNGESIAGAPVAMWYVASSTQSSDTFFAHGGFLEP